MQKKKLEKDEEDKFVEEAAELGCAAIKFKKPSTRGAPDRIVFCPGGKTFFFEFKRSKKGYGLSPQQRLFADDLIKLGFGFWVVYTCDEAIKILKLFK